MKKVDEKYVLNARFGRFFLELGCLIFGFGSLWLASRFLDPNYVVQGRGTFLNLLPHWLNVFIFGALAAGILLILFILVWIKISRRTMAVFDQDGVSLNGLFRSLYVHWGEVRSIRTIRTTRSMTLSAIWEDVRDLPDHKKARSHYSLEFVNIAGKKDSLPLSAHWGISNEELRQLLHSYRPDLIPAPKVEPEVQSNKPNKPIVASAQSWTG